MQEKAFDLVRALKVKQLDLLINISRRLTELLKRFKYPLNSQSALNEIQEQLTLLWH